MIGKAEIEMALAEKLEGSDLFLVDVDVQPANRIKVWIDGDQGVSIDQCAEINRFILNRFDRDAEDYSLEVSSPGLGQPLRLMRQYKKNVGRKVEIRTAAGTTEQGILQAVSEEGIALERSGKKEKKTRNTEVESISFSWKDISSAKVLLAF